MNRLKSLLKKKRKDILALGASHGARNFRVFGSVARREETAKSDLDLLIDMDPERSYLELGTLSLELQELLGCAVDVVTSDELHWYIRDRVLREAIPL